jgi:hypothetical protein
MPKRHPGRRLVIWRRRFLIYAGHSGGFGALFMRVILPAGALIGFIPASARLKAQETNSR